MLKSLTIKNYALISSFEIDFQEGFTTITGETGAGKSILLGALSLILGARADSSVLFDKTKKCVVEGKFHIKNYQLKNFFNRNELDYEEITVVRREIAADGKSRAFVNDTPVNLSILKELSPSLIDVHSQHQNLILGDSAFQINVLDSFAKNQKIKESYSTIFHRYKECIAEREKLIAVAEKSKSELDYLQYQFEQLSDAKLSESEQDELEKEQQFLTHAEDILSSFSKSLQIISEGEENVISKLHEVQNQLNSIGKFYQDARDIYSRIESALIELKDIAGEIETNCEKIEFNPEKHQYIIDRLDLIYSLQKKHKVNNISGLIAIKTNLENQIQQISTCDTEIEKLSAEIEKLSSGLTQIANQLSESRIAIKPKFEKEIMILLQSMGIPNATFEIKIEKFADFTTSGTDKVSFLFSANKSHELMEISKVASGGEISRFMLSVKYLIAGLVNLPTIIFDEIDTGVSGEIADKMGNIMKKMSKTMQVFSITHLPQIACKGEQHFFVFKTDEGQSTTTKIKLLTQQERLHEIAKMLSGSKLTDAALKNAMELLGAK